LASVAIYYLALNEFGQRCALFSTLFMASAQGMIVYVAQPKIYVFAIAGVVILLALQQRLFDPKRLQPAGALLFGVLFALFMQTYQNQPWLVGFALIAWLRGFDMRWTLLSLLLALFLSEWFAVLFDHLPQLGPVFQLLSDNPLGDHIKGLLQNRHLLDFLCQSLAGFGIVMTHAFNLCLVPALFGLFLVRRTMKRFLAILAIGLPAFMTYAFFEMGDRSFTQYPRLVYPAYPLVYILCGLCLAKLSEYPPFVRRPRIGIGAGILVVLLHFAWVNADVFGHPAIYYYWFNRSRGYA
jgi:hypothetical protein